MAEEEEVVNDGMIGEMDRKNKYIEELEDRSKRLEVERDVVLHEMERREEVHRLEQENLSLRAENALQQQGQSQTPLLDALTRFGREVNEMDERTTRRPATEDLDQH